MLTASVFVIVSVEGEEFCSERRRYLFTSPSSANCWRLSGGSSPAHCVMLPSNCGRGVEADVVVQMYGPV